MHEGSAAEALIDALLLAHEQGLDPMSLPLEEADRSLLAAVLMDEREELTPELLESAIRSLRRRVLRARSWTTCSTDRRRPSAARTRLGRQLLQERSSCDGHDAMGERRAAVGHRESLRLCKCLTQVLKPISAAEHLIYKGLGLREPVAELFERSPRLAICKKRLGRRARPVIKF